MSEPSILILTVQDSGATDNEFAALLLPGFGFRATLGLGLREFFEQEIGLSRDYVENSLRTVLLNGQPVDDIDTARLGPDCVLALSAAAPGAAGICMRRGSPYAALRADITHHADSEIPKLPGIINLKLFNFILKDLAGLCLRRGVLVAKRRLEVFWAENAKILAKLVEKVEFEGCRLGVDELPRALATRSGERIWLKICVEA